MKKCIYVLVVLFIIAMVLLARNSFADKGEEQVSNEVVITAIVEPEPVIVKPVVVTKRVATTEEQERIKSIIIETAENEGYPSWQLLEIARCESTFRPLVRGEVDSRDRGLYQINSHFNPAVTDECAFDPVCSTKWVIQELKAGNDWKWTASAGCWL